MPWRIGRQAFEPGSRVLYRGTAVCQGWSRRRPRGRVVLEGEAWNPFHGDAELYRHAAGRGDLENRDVPQADGQASGASRCRMEESTYCCGHPATEIALKTRLASYPHRGRAGCWILLEFACARLADSVLLLRTLNHQPPPSNLVSRSAPRFAVALLNNQFTFHVRVACADVVVRAFLPCDVAPRCSRVDGAGIKSRRLGFVSRCCGVGHGGLVHPFHGVARINGHGCWLKLEVADHNPNHLWWGAS